MISCGEASGDLYAGALATELRRRGDALEVLGLGGDRLQAQGATLLAHVRDLAVVGLLEVVSHLRDLRSVFRRILQDVDRRPPDAAVLVDYPDFNLRLAARARRGFGKGKDEVHAGDDGCRAGPPILGAGLVDRMLVILPFEEAIYREAGVPVTFVGFAGGALLLTPVLLAIGPRFTAEPVALAVLIYLGVVPTAVAYGLFFTGIKTVPGAVASIVTLLEPLTATALATIVLGERLSSGALLGGLLVLAAVAGLYVRRLRSPGAEPDPARVPRAA